jgi:hypothetical protein
MGGGFDDLAEAVRGAGEGGAVGGGEVGEEAGEFLLGLAAGAGVDFGAGGGEVEGDGAAVAFGDLAGDEALGDEAVDEAGGGGEGEGELGGEGGEGGAGAFAEDAHGADVDEGGVGFFAVVMGGLLAEEEEDVEHGFEDVVGADGGITCILQRLHVSIMERLCRGCKGRGDVTTKNARMKDERRKTKDKR